MTAKVRNPSTFLFCTMGSSKYRDSYYLDPIPARTMTVSLVRACSWLFYKAIFRKIKAVTIT